MEEILHLQWVYSHHFLGHIPSIQTDFSPIQTPQSRYLLAYQGVLCFAFLILLFNFFFILAAFL